MPQVLARSERALFVRPTFAACPPCCCCLPLLHPAHTCTAHSSFLLPLGSLGFCSALTWACSASLAGPPCVDRPGAVESCREGACCVSALPLHPATLPPPPAAAEDDVGHEEGAKSRQEPQDTGASAPRAPRVDSRGCLQARGAPQPASCLHHAGSTGRCSLLFSAAVLVRTYEYEGERLCDSRMAVFLKSIEAAQSGEGQGFAGAPRRRCCCAVAVGAATAAWRCKSGACCTEPFAPPLIFLSPAPPSCSHQGHGAGPARPAGARVRQPAVHPRPLPPL